jgi:hypothetical protein
MKVAAVYSGLVRTFKDWEENHKRITEHCDEIHYTTWEGRPTPEDKVCVTFPEPDINYRPMQVPEAVQRWPRMKHHLNNPAQMWLSKQIVAHQYACDHIGADDYDVIIRMRYDIYVGNHDWKKFIDQVAEEKVVISFGGWNGEMDKNKTICDEIIIPSDENGGSKMNGQILDFMNIHPGYKMKDGIRLHKEKKLMPANLGWQQTLGDPYEETPINYGGGVMLQRYREKNLHHVPGGF